LSIFLQFISISKGLKKKLQCTPVIRKTASYMNKQFITISLQAFIQEWNFFLGI